MIILIILMSASLHRTKPVLISKQNKNGLELKMTQVYS